MQSLDTSKAHPLSPQMRELLATGVNEDIHGRAAKLVDAEQQEEDEVLKEAKELYHLYNTITRARYGHMDGSEPEMELLRKYDCLVEGNERQEKILGELQWFQEKKRILDKNSGFFGRQKLYGKTIADWFDEYHELFPDGQCHYGGYDYEQTVRKVDFELDRLNAMMGNKSPILSEKGGFLHKEIITLINIKKQTKRAPSSGGNFDFDQFSFISNNVAMAFVVSGLSQSDGSFDGDSDGDSSGGGTDGGGDD